MPQDPHRFLIQRDREIPADLIPRLRELGILEVWIRHRDLEFLEDLIDEGLSDCQHDVYHNVRRNFETVMRGASVGLDIGQFQTSIKDMFGFLQGNPCGNVLLQKLDAFDNYLLSHSTNVCYMALLLGMKLEPYLIEERRTKTAREAKDIQELGLGCVLHDVGKMRISPAILNKPGRLTDDEMDLMKLHPAYGYEMVKGRAAAAQVVLNHHRRFDGGGYPPRIDQRTGDELPPLVGKQIPVFSRIATIVDIYDAATTRRCYSGAKPPVQVLHEMRTECASFFDPQIAKMFFEIIPPFPIGQIVTLSDQSEAVVVDFNPRRPVRPKVQGLRDPNGVKYRDPALHEVDLALHDDRDIVAIDGYDVQPYQTSQNLAFEFEPALA